MAKIKVGAFGAFRGITMITVLADHPDAELVAVCDKYEPLLQQVRDLAAAHNIEVACYTDFEEFFKHDMDAVVLANYANEHVPYAIRLLDSGRHVMSEVLPCANMAEAVALIEAVERSGKVYTYAENYCYMWHSFEMWRRFKSGELGEFHYGEGEYIHDVASIIPGITYGDRNHWRNHIVPNFYCTHSAGPLIAMTGLRPVAVTGFVLPNLDKGFVQGRTYGSRAGIEMIRMENGGVIKSMHGALKIERDHGRGNVNFQIFGSEGAIESERVGEELLHVYKETDHSCHGTFEHYHPEKFIEPELAMGAQTHGGSDFYPTHFFIQKILGRPEGEWAIDVYQAVDMGICGILANRSAVMGGTTIPVPDLRDPAQRELYRNDTTIDAQPFDPADPLNFGPNPNIPDEVYENVRHIWLHGNAFDANFKTRQAVLDQVRATTPTEEAAVTQSTFYTEHQ